MTPLQQGHATPRRLWIHVGDERWLGELVVAWPEAGQGLLVVGAQRQSSVLAKREAALAAPRNDYDPLYASRWWHILLGVTRVLERYRTPFVGKSSPVQFWWGSFDLATTCGIALIMVLAARLHARRKEPGAIAVNVVLLALAVLVAWGASARTPSEPASGYAMRLTVFGGTSPPDSSSSSKPCRAATPSRPSRVTRPNWPPGRD